MAKNKTAIWFREVRGSYLPSSNVGLLIYLLYVAYIVAIMVDWYHLGHDFWPLLTTVIPLTIGAAALVQAIAWWHSKRR